MEKQTKEPVKEQSTPKCDILYVDEQLMLFGVIVKVIEGELTDEVTDNMLGTACRGWTTSAREAAKSVNRDASVSYIYLGERSLSRKEKIFNFISGSIYLLDYIMSATGIKLETSKNGNVNSITEIRSYILSALVDNFLSTVYRDDDVFDFIKEKIILQDEILSGKTLVINPDPSEEELGESSLGRLTVKEGHTLICLSKTATTRRRLATLVHELNHYLDSIFVRFEGSLTFTGNEHTDIRVDILLRILEKIISFK